MKAGLAIWRAITKTPLTVITAAIMACGVLGAGYFLVTHGYKIGFDAKFELAPSEGAKQSAK